MNIFVAKLNFDTRESDLQNAFEAHGAVDSVRSLWINLLEDQRVLV